MSECCCLCAPAGHEHHICTGTAEPGHSVPLPGSPGTFVPACPPCHRATHPHRGHHPLRRPGEQPRRLDARDWDAAALARPGERSARWPKAATTG
ncbi:hypothetical protein MUY14_10220 [Amycolatopsis sp. FBCC-B4732]|uniref:hypothetical protein n=1 Tax=unclassified Amycolatopsis TaxID=2618356 RepID=UPI001FF0FB18|nr:hypothetical protein [Amycolatopsis sp. FBCC-B4732]UOX90974.1 hypothetical protein MUY14_10220 [Amycolatopsis sp. FBCC-B4732]